MSQQNKTTLQSAINTQLADNTSGDISAADVRDNLINMTDSLLFNSGSQNITGTLTATSFTGSLQGTATTATSASFATTASYTNTAGAAQTATSVYTMATNSNSTLYPALVGASFSSFNTLMVDNGGEISYNPSTNTLTVPNIAGFAAAFGSSSYANGEGSFSQGKGVTATGSYSHAEGQNTTAGGNYSHAEGLNNTATGDYSHAEGNANTAFGNLSHAEGFNTTSEGVFSHTEGNSTYTTGDYSHAEGYSTTTYGDFSHAEGYSTIARGTSSHAEGLGTIASGSYQHVQGQYNTQGDSTSLMIVGNGTSTGARKDAFKVRMSGSIVLPNTQSAAPSWTGADGEMVFATVTGAHYFYVWMSGAWRSGSLS